VWGRRPAPRTVRRAGGSGRAGRSCDGKGCAGRRRASLRGCRVVVGNGLWRQVRRSREHRALPLWIWRASPQTAQGVGPDTHVTAIAANASTARTGPRVYSPQGLSLFTKGFRGPSSGECRPEPPDCLTRGPLLHARRGHPPSDITPSSSVVRADGTPLGAVRFHWPFHRPRLHFEAIYDRHYAEPQPWVPLYG
jgi:hypothetical protein